MEKTKGFLGIKKRVLNKPKNTKKGNKKMFLEKVVDYLKSDFYMFAPLVTSPQSNALSGQKIYACSGVEPIRLSEGRNRNFPNKVEEYLKSDFYMYAPLVDPQLYKVDSAIVPPLKGEAATSVLPREVLKEIDQPLKGSPTKYLSPRTISKEIEQPLKRETTASVSAREIFKEVEKPSKSKAKASFTKSVVLRQTIARRKL